MIFSQSFLYISITLLFALLLAGAAWYMSKRGRVSAASGDECERMKIEYSAFERAFANLLFGPRITTDDLSRLLYDVRGVGLDEITTSRSKIAQAVAVISELKRRGVLLQAQGALYRARPDLITNP